MAEANAGLHVAVQASLQINFTALQSSAAKHVFRTDKLALQPGGAGDCITRLHTSFSPPFIDDGGGIVKGQVGAREIGFAFQVVAIVLDFKPVAHTGAGYVMLGSGKLGAKQRLRVDSEAG